MEIVKDSASIFELASNNDFILVSAPTGSGKSIALPAFFAAHGYRCMVSVPTVVSAISLSNYQRYINKKSESNVRVGYAAEGDVKYDEGTNIIYATSGHVRRKIINQITNGKPTDLNFADFLFLDEIHNGSVDNAVIISLWNWLYNNGKKIPRLILMSATPSDVIIRNPQGVPMTVPTYEVTTSKLYEVRRSYYHKSFELYDKQIYKETADLVLRLYNDPSSKGNFLVFAPGAGEVKTIIDFLNKMVTEQKLLNSLIIPAYSSLDDDNFNKILSETKERKIIVSTNVAESSITIPNIVFVVDTMTEKIPETSSTGGIRLVTSYISKSSAIQREGRTGRTNSGYCYRMCTEEKYETLPENKQPEINRIPIYGVIMEILNSGLIPENILISLDTDKIKESEKLLFKLGMINEKREVTKMGEFSVTVPLSVRNSSFLYRWREAKYPDFPGLVFASLIDGYGPSYFFTPRSEFHSNEKMELHRIKWFNIYFADNEVLSLLKMFVDLASYLGQLETSDSKDKYVKNRTKKYCDIHSLNYKKIREFQNILKKGISILNCEAQNFRIENVLKAAIPILQVTHSDLVMKRKNNGNYEDSFGSEYKLATYGFVNKPVFSENLIALITTEIRRDTSFIRNITLYVPIS